MPNNVNVFACSLFMRPTELAIVFVIVVVIGFAYHRKIQTDFWEKHDEEKREKILPVMVMVVVVLCRTITPFKIGADSLTTTFFVVQIHLIIAFTIEIKIRVCWRFFNGIVCHFNPETIDDRQLEFPNFQFKPSTIHVHLKCVGTLNARGHLLCGMNATKKMMEMEQKQKQK